MQVYSEELETIAQEFANRCIITHSDGRERSSNAPSFIVVENIYSGVGLPVNYTDIVTRHWGLVKQHIMTMSPTATNLEGFVDSTHR